jgi:hypothetical protein
LIFLIPVEDAILCCPMWVCKLSGVVEGLFAPGRRVVERWADVAAGTILDARHLVAKVHVCRRGSRAIEAAERIAAEAEEAGLMVGVLVVDWMV